MRVLFVHNYYKNLGGGEDRVFDLEVSLLQESGLDVDVFVTRNHGAKNAFDLVKIGFNTLFCYQAYSDMLERIRLFKPDVIHVHNLFPQLSPAVLYAAKKCRVPVVMTLHNYRLSCANAVMLRENTFCNQCNSEAFPLSAIKYGCYMGSPVATVPVAGMIALHRYLKTWQKCVARFVMVSDAQKQLLLEANLGLDPQKITVKPNFVFDTEELSYSKDNYFLFVGNLAQHKGVPLLLEVFQNVQYPLKLIGLGELQPLVEQAATENPHIEYLGYQSPEIVRAFMAKAKAIVLPSLCYETFGMVIIEAFSVATPAVVSNIGGPGCIVQEGNNGLLVEPGNADDLKAKLTQLWNDQDLHQTLSRNARLSYERQYSPQENRDQLMRIYHEVISGSSST